MNEWHIHIGSGIGGFDGAGDGLRGESGWVVDSDGLGLLGNAHNDSRDESEQHGGAAEDVARQGRGGGGGRGGERADGVGLG